jgi:hypothetical protein
MRPLSESLTHDEIQRAIVRSAHRLWPGIDLQGSLSGVYLRGGAVEGRLMVLKGVEAGDPDLNGREIGSNGQPGFFIEVKTKGQNDR